MYELLFVSKIDWVLDSKGKFLPKRTSEYTSVVLTQLFLKESVEFLSASNEKYDALMHVDKQSPKNPADGPSHQH